MMDRIEMKPGSPGRSLKTFVSLALRADPWRVLLMFFIDVMWKSTGLVSAYGAKLMVDAVIVGDTRGVLISAVLVGAPVGIGRLGGPAYIRIMRNLTESVQFEVESKLARAVGNATGMEHHENPKYLDQVSLAAGQRGLVSRLIGMIAENLQAIILLIGTLALLARLDARALLLPIFGLPALYINKLAATVAEKTSEATAETGRRRSHIFSIVSSPAAGKELRVFQLGKRMENQHQDLSNRLHKALNISGAKQAGLRAIGGLFFALGYIGFAALIIQKAARGQATPGDVLLALSLASQINGHVAGLAESSGAFARALTSAKRFQGVLDYSERTQLPPDNPSALPERLSYGIEFKNVSFSYMDASEKALDDVSLTLPAGSVVALVGENGAGKTTLVKLLSRMYEPSEGSITVDGVQLNHFDPVEWRTRLSAAFQDFVRFELTLREAVGVGDLPRIADEKAVLDALDRAGARELVGVGPKGLDTQLGRNWEGGIELSGGQWQKLALARAEMRDLPLLLMLDEPTSALDAETEHALFERVASASRLGATQGMITLLVSHRFSTVRMADLIIVLKEGRILEVGSHSELVQSGGLYQELFEMQARGYR